MPAKTPAKPARQPVKRRVSHAPTTAKPAKARPAKSRIESKTKSDLESEIAPDSELPTAKPVGKAVSLLKEGRHVPSKILHEDMSAPVSTLLARVSSAIEDELTQIEMIVSGGVKLRERSPVSCFAFLFVSALLRPWRPLTTWWRFRRGRNYA